MGSRAILFICLLSFSCASIEKNTYYDFKTTKPKISKEVAKSDISVAKNITPDFISFLITEDITCEEKESREKIKYRITNKTMDKSGWLADFFLSSIFGGISFMAFKTYNEGKIFGINRVGETEFSKMKNELLITGIISGAIGGIFAIDFVISPFLAIDTSEEIEREKYERVIRAYECDKKPLDNIPVEISFEKASITSIIKKGVVNVNPQKVSEILKSSSPYAYLIFRHGGIERKFPVDFSMFAPPSLVIIIPEKIAIYPGENIIDITVKNKGGIAKNATLTLESEELGLKKKLDLGDIKQGEEKKISIPVFHQEAQKKIFFIKVSAEEKGGSRDEKIITAILKEEKDKIELKEVAEKESKDMMSAEQIFELYSDSVVFIICHSNLWEGSQGTGFFISDDGYILTNDHVVEDCNRINVKLKDGREIEAQKLWGNPKIDAAIIKVKGQKFKPIPIGNTDEVRIGSKVYVIGNPKGLEWTISEGIVSQIRMNPFSSDKFKIIQTTAPISYGSSGSPLITSQGKVIGIMSWSLKEAQNLNFAVSIDDIDPLDKIAKIKSGEINRGRRGGRNLRHLK